MSSSARRLGVRLPGMEAGGDAPRVELRRTDSSAATPISPTAPRPSSSHGPPQAPPVPTPRTSLAAASASARRSAAPSSRDQTAASPPPPSALYPADLQEPDVEHHDEADGVGLPAEVVADMEEEDVLRGRLETNRDQAREAEEMRDVIVSSLNFKTQEEVNELTDVLAVLQLEGGDDEDAMVVRQVELFEAMEARAEFASLTRNLEVLREEERRLEERLGEVRAVVGERGLAEMD